MRLLTPNLVRITILCLTFLLVHGVYAQNLVPNPSFEENTGFPNDFAQWDLVNGWTNINGIPGFSAATPDYYHAQATSSFLTFPNTLGGTLAP
ncbi:MAG: hypothetical protein AAGH79_13330, partial [Bacteroidota bacterium]